MFCHAEHPWKSILSCVLYCQIPTALRLNDHDFQILDLPGSTTFSGPPIFSILSSINEINMSVQYLHQSVMACSLTQKSLWMTSMLEPMKNSNTNCKIMRIGSWLAVKKGIVPHWLSNITATRSQFNATVPLPVILKSFLTNYMQIWTISTTLHFWSNKWGISKKSKRKAVCTLPSCKKKSPIRQAG